MTQLIVKRFRSYLKNIIILVKPNSDNILRIENHLNNLIKAQKIKQNVVDIT